MKYQESIRGHQSVILLKSYFCLTNSSSFLLHFQVENEPPFRTHKGKLILTFPCEFETKRQLCQNEGSKNHDHTTHHQTHRVGSFFRNARWLSRYDDCHSPSRNGCDANRFGKPHATQPTASWEWKKSFSKIPRTSAKAKARGVKSKAFSPMVFQKHRVDLSTRNRPRAIACSQKESSVW